MDKIKRSEVSPQAPRIPKPQDIYSRYQVQRPSREEEKRIEQNYFMRRVIPKQRGHKPSILHEPGVVSQNESKESIEVVSNSAVKPEEKRRTLRANQPRQKPQEKKEILNLSNLSNIVMEMKEMLNNMPNLQEIQNKSYEHGKKKNSTVTPKNKSREISLHDKTIRKSMKLKNYILNSKPTKRLMSSKGPRPSTTTKYSRPLPVLKTKPNDDISAIQSYFQEFHAKSKFLLKNLEKSVLGDNKVL
jgi:hypothetical protein